MFACVQHVWSESEDCLPFLQLAQDYISSCGKKTLLEVLEKVFTSFRPVRKPTSMFSSKQAAASFTLETELSPFLNNKIRIRVMCASRTHYLPSAAD